MASEDQYKDTGATTHQWPANFKLAAKEHCARLPLPAWGDWAKIAGFPQDPAQRLAFVDNYLSTKLGPVDMRTAEEVTRNLRPRIRGDLNKYRGWLLTQVAAQLHTNATTMDSGSEAYHSIHDGEAYLLPEDLPKAIDDLFLHQKFIGSSIQAYPNTVALRDATQPFAPAYYFGPDAQHAAHKAFLAEEGGNGDAFRLATLDDGTEIILPFSQAASTAYGSPRWCTAWKDEQYFENHLADGLLYIVTTPQGKRFQAHFESNQFRDVHDEQIGLERFPPSSAAFLSDHSMLAAAIGRLIDTAILNKTAIMHPLLHWGASNGHFSIVKQLIERGAALDVSNESGSTALHLAARNGYSDIVKLLIEKGAALVETGAALDVTDVTNEGGNTALHLAARYDHSDIVRLLIETGATLDVSNGDGNTALHLAVRYGRSHVAKLLIERGATLDVINAGGDSALHQAAWYGYSEIARLLIEEGAALTVSNAMGYTALHYAARHDRTAIAKRLIEKGAALGVTNSDGGTALHHAALYGGSGVAKLLIDRGVPLDVVDEGGGTALHLAAYGGHTDIAELLVRNGAALDTQDKAGDTALHQAALIGHSDIAQLLIESGAAHDVANRDGNTALHQAARFGRSDIAKLLIEKGAALDAPDKAGDTALNQAARNGHIDIAQLLIEKGAALDAPDKAGDTALQLAACIGHTNIVGALQRAQPKTEAVGAKRPATSGSSPDLWKIFGLE